MADEIIPLTKKEVENAILAMIETQENLPPRAYDTYLTQGDYGAILYMMLAIVRAP